MLSLTAVVVLLPLILLVALANWLVAGSVLFRQVRLGRDLRPFWILKFQTMVDGAHTGPSITIANDRRVTPLGRWLRAMKLDELPQLFNVLRGEMSLVGPRALTPNEVAHLSPDVAALVYSVRPGMTGLGSLVLVDEERVLAAAADPKAYYYDVVLPQKASLEVQYVRGKNLWLDLAILALTPIAIVSSSSVRLLLDRIAPMIVRLELTGRRGANDG